LRCGITLHIQSYQDWDEYEAAELGASVAPLDPQFDAKRFTDELGSALKLEVLRADSISTVEHYSSLYVCDKPHPVAEFRASSSQGVYESLAYRKTR
jgi:hypothetical protein